LNSVVFSISLFLTLTLIDLHKQVNDKTFEVLTATLMRFQVFGMLRHTDVSKYFILKYLVLKMKALHYLVNSVTIYLSER